MAVHDKSEGQFLELEVTSPEGQDYSNYSYLRMGAWEQGTLGAQAQQIAKLARAASSDPSASNVAALATALDLSSDDRTSLNGLRSSYADQSGVAATARTAYTTAKTAFDQADTTWKAKDAALAPVNAAKDALNQAEADLTGAQVALASSNATGSALATLQAAVATATTKRDAAKATHDALKTANASRISERDAAAVDRAAKLTTLTAATARLEADYPQYKAAKGAFETRVAEKAGAKIKAIASAAPEQRKNRGEDLAAMVTDFFDDPRYRGPNEPTEETRETETSVLHTKGGWRDHSEGNRISTTRGDKVEVIRGNYRQLVLGRQDEPDNGSIWEAGGGLFQDNDIAPGAISEIKWVQNYGGTWMVTEDTLRGDQISRYHGDVREEYYGNKITSIVGGEGTDDVAWKGGDDGDGSKKNPTIVEKTWAESIDAQTGSSSKPVPRITEVTWAKDIREETHAVTLHELTQVDAGIVSTTAVGGGIVETTTAPTMLEFTIIGAGHIEVEIAPLHVGLALSLVEVEVFGGYVKAEVFGGKHLEIDTWKTEVELQGMRLVAKADEIAGLRTQIEGVRTEILGDGTTVGALSTAVTNAETRINTAALSMGQVETRLRALHLIT